MVFSTYEYFITCIPTDIHHFSQTFNIRNLINTIVCLCATFLYLKVICIYMKDDTSTNFVTGDMEGKSSNTKEILYMQYILSTLTEARRSFDTGDTQRFNLYCSFLKNSILDKVTRDRVDQEMLSEEKRLKNLGYDDKFVEFGIGFIVVREIMSYINETMELEHDDIMGSVGNFEVDDDSDGECDDVIIEGDASLLSDYPDSDEDE
jgi:hypothetical protein